MLDFKLMNPNSYTPNINKLNKSLGLEKLAAMGSYFIYDLDGLKQHAQYLKDNNVAKLFYACKANPLSTVLQTLHNCAFCFDAASEGELQQILNVGVPGSNIIMTGPAKSANMLRLGLENRVDTVVVESLNQLALLEKLSRDCRHIPNILLRLQLHWEDEEASVLGGNKTTHFGMDLYTARQALQRMDDMRMPFLGFHVFQWGNILSPTKLRTIWQHTIETCRSLKADFKVLDVGGGLGIPYDNQAPPLLWNEVITAIAELKQQYKLDQFWLELGRYLIGPYGYYITQVIDRKITYGKEILVLAGGINHLARSALINETFPAQLLRNFTGNSDAISSSLMRFSLYGPLCTALDFLGEQMLPVETAVGDVVMFSQVGAYGFTESMPLFLCHDLAGEAVIINDEIQIIRKPQSASMWLK